MYVNYNIDDYNRIVEKLRFLLPYSNGITISGEDNLLLWDVNYYVEINHNDKFHIKLKKIKYMLKDSYHIEYYDDMNFFLDKPKNNKHIIEHNIIKTLIAKRFTQIEKDYEERIKEVYE